MIQHQAGAARQRGGAKETSQGMTAPTKVIFQEWKKPGVTYELHGWRPEEGLAFISSA